MIPVDLLRTTIGELAALLLDCAANAAWLKASPAIAPDRPDRKKLSGGVIVVLLA